MPKWSAATRRCAPRKNPKVEAVACKWKNSPSCRSSLSMYVRGPTATTAIPSAIPTWAADSPSSSFIHVSYEGRDNVSSFLSPTPRSLLNVQSRAGFGKPPCEGKQAEKRLPNAVASQSRPSLSTPPRPSRADSPRYNLRRFNELQSSRSHHIGETARGTPRGSLGGTQPAR